MLCLNELSMKNVSLPQALGLLCLHISPQPVSDLKRVKIPFLKIAKHNIGIKHGFPCINVCQVPREMLKTEAVGRGFQHLPRDRANVYVLENHV